MYDRRLRARRQGRRSARALKGARPQARKRTFSRAVAAARPARPRLPTRSPADTKPAALRPRMHVPRARCPGPAPTPRDCRRPQRSDHDLPLRARHGLRSAPTRGRRRPSDGRTGIYPHRRETHDHSANMRSTKQAVREETRLHRSTSSPSHGHTERSSASPGAACSSAACCGSRSALRSRRLASEGGLSTSLA